ncbi:MAG: tetratricopeptide repeat protein [Verrucomicrobiales bacterium]|nr:tetratricopeptide repeat protein [Verrucomicrobiales bacterium]
MKSKPAKPSARRARPSGHRLPPLTLVASLLGGIALSAAALLWLRSYRSTPDSHALAASPSPKGPVTFTQHIAPLLYQHCYECHRHGQSGPFHLISYEDAKKHAVGIADVTRRRFMPPWLAADTVYPFQDRRGLSSAEIDLIQQWVADGSPEGPRSALPPLPSREDGWQLGPPDLVVTLPEPYTLPGEGRDVYRNFVVPLNHRERRYVRAFEFRPGSKAVHHAFLRIDASGESRRLDARDPGLGFGGMDIPPSADTPTGHFMSWQPGRRPSVVPDGLAWTLPAGADVVLLMHMQPLGRPEPLQPSIGFYFTDVPPTNTPTKLGLRSYAIDLPAGSSNTVIEESVTLPVDADLLALLPHAHYLARRMEGYAQWPNGTRKTLLLIPEWDFNWQTDFRFAHPVSLPAGTVLGFKYTYDNSTNNPRNPSRPPVPVGFGLQTTDEMGELWFQLLAPKKADREKLEEVSGRRGFRDLELLTQLRLRKDPNDAEAITELGKIHLARGDAGLAVQQWNLALKLRPDLADAHYHLGLVALQSGEFAKAESAFVESARLRPEHFQSFVNAGVACMRQGKLGRAGSFLQEALRLHPGDTVAADNLRLVQEALAKQRPGTRP